MKILVITDRYPPHYVGGYELRCYDTVQGLVDRGHDIFILTSKFGLAKGEIQGRVMRILESCSWGFGALRGWKYIIFQIKRVPRYRNNYAITKKTLEEISPDLIYVWHFADISITPILACLDLRYQVVFDIGDITFAHIKSYFEIGKHRIRSLLRFLLTGIWNFQRYKFENFIFISKYLQNIFDDHGFQYKNCAIIPSSILVPSDDIIDFNHSFDHNRINLIFVGRIVKEKGIHVAIAALDLLKKWSWEFNLDIIGDADEDYKKSLLKLIDDLGLNKNVKFLGKYPPDELKSYYKKYDIFLHPCIWNEPFGKTIIEAMSCGVPVIASGTGGIPEIIIDHENGILVPPNDPLKLAEAIKELAENPSLVKKIRENGFSCVKERHSPSRGLENIEKFLYKIYNDNKG